MKTTKNIFYESSNSINPQGLLVAALLCIVLAFFLGFIYTGLIVMIPFIYIGIVINIGMGLSIGVMVGGIARLTHNRNRKSQYGLALLLGACVAYFQWIAYFVYIMTENMPNFGLYCEQLGALFDREVWAFLAEINAVGMWSVFGTNVSGGLLTLVWVIEFLMILLIPIFYLSLSKEYPYAEDIGKWYSKYTLEENYSIPYGSHKLLSLLQENVLNTIQSLPLGRANRYVKVHILYLEEASTQYLSIERVFINHNGSDDKDMLVENFCIDNNTAKQLLNSIEHKKRWVEFF